MNPIDYLLIFLCTGNLFVSMISFGLLYLLYKCYYHEDVEDSDGYLEHMMKESKEVKS